MTIYDISWPLSPTMTAYKNNKSVTFTALKEFERDLVRESLLSFNAHSGTHIDAPSHFLKDGATIEQQNLSALIGPARVIDLTDVVDHITAVDLQKHGIKAGQRILLRTKNSDKKATDPFDPAFVFIDHTAAQFLATQKIAAIGIDYLGVERSQPGHETHTILFNAGIAIIEGLRLAEVASEHYFLCCLPLKIVGLEAAPARAVLWSIDE